MENTLNTEAEKMLYGLDTIDTMLLKGLVKLLLKNKVISADEVKMHLVPAADLQDIENDDRQLALVLRNRISAMLRDESPAADDLDAMPLE